jgi:hypothetical protein
MAAAKPNTCSCDHANYYCLLCFAAGLYAVAPEAGVVTGGSSQQFTLRFSPTEVEDVRRTIMCHMPVLEQLAATATGAAADAFKQLTREVTGKVRAQPCAQTGTAVVHEWVAACHRIR